MNETKENSSLPEGWSVVRLGDYAKTEKGKKPKVVSKEKTIECFIPYINIKAFERGIIDEYTDGKGCVICEDDDFLMVWDGSRSGYVGKAIKGALGSTLVKIKLPDVDHDFAYYFLQSKFVEINTRAKGVGIPHVDPNIVWNYKFPLPPKTTQQAIVSKIEELFSELDKSIEALRLAQQQLKTYRQAVIKWAFEGKLTEEWRKENGTRVRVPAGSQKVRVIPSGLKLEFIAAEPLADYPIANNDSKNDELPEGWKWKKISNIAAINPKLPNRESIESDLVVQFLPMKLVEEIINKIHLTETKKFIEVQKGSYTPFIDGDIIFAKVTPCMENGKIAIVDKLKNGIGYGSSEFHVVRCQSEVLNGYLFYFLVQDRFRNEAEQAMTGAVGLRRVPKQFIENHTVPLPLNKEQKEIVLEIESRLSVANKMEESITQSLQQAEALRQSILKKAFEGKLIVEKKPTVYKPKSKYFYQAQFLGLVIRASKKIDIAHGEMTIAKYAYLVDKIYNIPTYYDYQRWHLGPYPPEIKKAINNKNFFKKQNGNIEVADEKSLFKHDNHYQKEIENAVDNLSIIFSKYSSNERSHKTELLATICKVVEDIQTLDLRAVRASMKDWKIDLETSTFKNKSEKFTETETEKCLAFLVEKQWDKKLIKSLTAKSN